MGTTPLTAHITPNHTVDNYVDYVDRIILDMQDFED